MIKPAVWSLNQLKNNDLRNAVIWTIPQLVNKVQKVLQYPIIKYPSESPDKSNLDSLIVSGGGVLIDEAKIWRNENNINLKLIAIPSIWGSGAENSKVAVKNDNGVKIIFVGEEYLPDVRVQWPELAEGLDDELLKNACGDVWAHTLECFLSPIAKDSIRQEAVEILRILIDKDFCIDSEWFELSARSSAVQAQSSVGLIHGIAHVIEGKLLLDPMLVKYGHAALCRYLLLPVMSFNIDHTDIVTTLFNQYSIDGKKVINKITELFDIGAFAAFQPLIERHWKEILREPMTRTNCTLVRKDLVSYFLGSKFL